MSRFTPLQISSFFHAFFVVAAASWYFAGKMKSTQKIDFEVYENPQVVSAKTTLDASPPKPAPPPPKEEKRAVFGVQRNAVTVDSGAGAEVKQGNTIAKENDNLTLNKDDADALPIPADEFLVTQMPKVRKEVRALYPPDAKKAGITGAVVIEILIDQKGNVREAKVISGPGSGLNEAAVEALKQFEFSPAQIKDQSVAVKVRYTYRFVLESM